jgi:hypothetical protein
MAHRLTSTFTLAALLALGVGTSANAGPITFTFDTTTTPACTGLAAGAAPSTITTYMNCVLGGSYVTVQPGAVASRGAAAGTAGTTVAAGYTADGHAVGVTGGNQSLTLGNTENATSSASPLTAGAADAYLMNNSLASTSNTQVALQFQNGFTIGAGSQIKFDYEIFPDNTCTALTSASCGGTGTPNRPDFEFWINGAQVGSTLFGNTPGTGGTYTYSPAMTGGETAPQTLGVFTYTVGSALVNPLLAFVDWPATIGIDNLTITPPNQSVPEPVTLTLLAIGMAGVRTYRRRMTA